MEPNILLIVCDTLRKDIIDLYGGEAKMPNLRKLAKDSMVYDNCIAPSPWTFPSHVSLFTGLYPSEHGIHETKDVKVEQLRERHMRLGAERLAEFLSARGYNTLGVSNNLMVSRFTGFDRGFRNFFNIEPSPWSRSKIATEARNIGAGMFQISKELIAARRINDMLKYAKEFMRIKSLAKAVNYPMDKGAELTNSLITYTPLYGKFFLFVNYYEMHEPYKGFDEKEMLDNLLGIRKTSAAKVERLKGQYVSEAEYLDSRLGELIGTLRSRGVYDDTMVIITSDHGQAFNEHGFMYHGTYLYDEIVRIPLIIKYPHGRRFRKRPGCQSLCNIFPLIRDILDGKDDRRVTTGSAFAEAYGNTEHIPKAYSHMMPYIEKTYEKVRKAVYTDSGKMTFNDTDGTIEELYDGKREIDPNGSKAKGLAKTLSTELNRFGKRDGFRVSA